ncbi:MAG TPA: hypothetical protein VM369_03700 [Candidatus Binatia bacterium]|nr:hypothetical protein [Candidatus Binatia bacterium]
MNRILFPFVLAAALAACAHATPYQRADRGEGYTDQKIENARYRISFAGNRLTPRETVENYLLYRAAELTLENGFDYFVLAERSTDAQTQYQQSVSAFGGFGHYGWYPAGVFGLGTSFPISSSTQYVAQADVLMQKGRKPAGDTKAFDARQVKENLEPSVRRPEHEGDEDAETPEGKGY